MNFSNIARLAWRTLLRDLRAGELRLVLVAVTLAVAALIIRWPPSSHCKQQTSITRQQTTFANC